MVDNKSFKDKLDKLDIRRSGKEKQEPEFADDKDFKSSLINQGMIQPSSKANLFFEHPYAMLNFNLDGIFRDPKDVFYIPISDTTDAIPYKSIQKYHVAGDVI